MQGLARTRSLGACRKFRGGLFEFFISRRNLVTVVFSIPGKIAQEESPTSCALKNQID
jgi:hypothetical protein